MNKNLLLGIAALGFVGLVGAGAHFASQSLTPIETVVAEPSTFTIRARIASVADPGPVRIHMWDEASGKVDYIAWASDPTMNKSQDGAYWVYTYDAPLTFGVSDNNVIDRIIFRYGDKKTDDIGFAGYFHNCPSDYGFTLDVSGANVVATEGYFSSFDTTKARVWLNRNGHYADNGYSYYLKANGVYYPAIAWTEMFSGSVYWPHFDIPRDQLDDKSLCFAVFETGHGANNTFGKTAAFESNSVTYREGDNSHYVDVYNDEGLKMRMSGTVSNVLASAFPTILGGYFSCLSNGDNGYGAFATFNTTWSTDNVNGNLAAVNLTDYASHIGANEEYYASATKNTSFTCAAKINDMTSRYNAAHPANIIPSAMSQNETAPIIAVYGIAAGLSVGAFFFIRKLRLK